MRFKNSSSGGARFLKGSRSNFLRPHCRKNMYMKNVQLRLGSSRTCVYYFNLQSKRKFVAVLEIDHCTHWIDKITKTFCTKEDRWTHAWVLSVFSLPGHFWRHRQCHLMSSMVQRQLSQTDITEKILSVNLYTEEPLTAEPNIVEPKMRKTQCMWLVGISVCYIWLTSTTVDLFQKFFKY